MRCLSLFFVSVSVGLLSAADGRNVLGADNVVRLTPKADALEVTIGGQLFTTYNHAKTQKKPYFWPIHDLAGQIITRPLVKPGERIDHPHHRGLWFAVDRVNGIKFWAEGGRIENISVEPIVSIARFKVVNHWLDRNKQTVLIETTTITIYANRLIAYDATLTAAKEPVTFDDTKEGLFGFRMVNSMRGSAGTIVKHGRSYRQQSIAGARPSLGSTTMARSMANWSAWRSSTTRTTSAPRAITCEITGYSRSAPSANTTTARLADSKAGAAGQPGPWRTKKTLRYAIYIHDGDTKAGDVAGAYQKYVAESGG